MRKLKLFFLFGVTLFAASTWAADTQGPWTRTGYRTGTCGEDANDGISFAGLNNSHWGTVDGWVDGDGAGYTVRGEAVMFSKHAVFSMFSMSRQVPSYSRCQITWKYRLRSCSYKVRSTTTLYEHTDQGALQNLTVDFTYNNEYSYGSQYRIASFNNSDKSDVGISSSEYTRTYDFNNLTGTSDATHARYLLLTHVANNNSISYRYDLHEWGSLLHVSAVETWTYRAIITFDANGGTGTMDNQTIDNSGNLTDNAFTRAGYTFIKWTANPDGTGETYDNKGAVTVNADYKGPKTLYAQWALNPSTNVSYLDSLDNTVVQETVAFNRPEDPEVAGFTFVRWDVIEGPLSEGIKLQAIYAENEPSGAPKKQVGKFTLIRKEGAENEYILQLDSANDK